MNYRHSMTCYTEGIKVLAPVKWRGLDGLMSVFWDAEGQPGAKGYYLSPDPRIVIFFNDVSPHIRMTNREGGIADYSRPMTRAVYVPAGVPLWTNFTSPHRFSHLDLHLHKDKLLRFLSPSVGFSAALAALRRPVEIQDVGAIETLAALLVDEVSNPSKHAIYAESLVGSIVSGLLDIPDPASEQANGRLTPGTDEQADLARQRPQRRPPDRRRNGLDRGPIRKLVRQCLQADHRQDAAAMAARQAHRPGAKAAGRKRADHRRHCRPARLFRPGASHESLSPDRWRNTRRLAADAVPPLKHDRYQVWRSVAEIARPGL
jgi:hypothetical protein